MRKLPRSMNQEELHLETWESNSGEREDHYFLDKEKRVYLFGYNPKFVNAEQLAVIFKILGVK